jgi:hypothetical protein
VTPSIARRSARWRKSRRAGDQRDGEREDCEIVDVILVIAASDVFPSLRF